MIKRLICALIAIAMVLSAPMLYAPLANAEEAGKIGNDWRDRSPLTAGAILNPLAMTLFMADVPIYILVREQPFTAGLTEMDLIDGLNPITGKWSGEPYEAHAVDVTDNY